MARRFRFRLQPVMEHRQRIEDEKKQVVALRLRAHVEACAELDRLDEAFRAGSLAIREGHAALDAEALRLHYSHLQFLDRSIDAQIKLVAERLAALNRARAELLTAQRARKVVERLRERRAEAHRAEEFAIEQRELDDANARAHGRAQLSMGGSP